MLDIKKELADIASAYVERPRAGLSSMLIYSTPGAGKTTLLATAPAPVFIYQFDPDGCESVEDYILGTNGKPKLIYPKDFSVENPMKPTMFKAFAADLRNRKENKFFDYMGTVVIDSITTLAGYVMNWILTQGKKGSHVGEPPEIQEWGLQIIKVRDIIYELLTLPCHIIVTGHEGTDQDDLLKIFIGSVAITKGIRIAMPVLFSEMYRLKVKATSKGFERSLITSNDGIWVAKTRMGHDGKLGKEIPPNIKEALKIVGKSWEDKPLP